MEQTQTEKDDNSNQTNNLSLDTIYDASEQQRQEEIKKLKDRLDKIEELETSITEKIQELESGEKSLDDATRLELVRELGAHVSLERNDYLDVADPSNAGIRNSGLIKTIKYIRKLEQELGKEPGKLEV